MHSSPREMESVLRVSLVELRDAFAISIARGGQNEMLMPILAKEPLKKVAAKKPSGKARRKSA